MGDTWPPRELVELETYYNHSTGRYFYIHPGIPRVDVVTLRKQWERQKEFDKKMERLKNGR